MSYIKVSDERAALNTVQNEQVNVQSPLEGNPTRKVTLNLEQMKILYQQGFFKGMKFTSFSEPQSVSSRSI